MKERDMPEVGECSFIDRQVVGGKPAHMESKEDRGTRSEATPRLQLPIPDLQLVRLDHAPALLAFERENRAYFAASIPDRGDSFFAEFDTRHAQLLERQAAGTDYFHLLVTARGEVVGRVNLAEVADGSAELGYRIAQKAAGQGLATAAVRKVREEEFTDAEVAEQLNQQGFHTFEGLPFHSMHVYQLRRHHGLADRYARLRARGMLTVEELAHAYGVTAQTIWRWHRQGSIAGMRYNDRGSCLFLPKASQPLLTEPK